MSPYIISFKVKIFDSLSFIFTLTPPLPLLYLISVIFYAPEGRIIECLSLSHFIIPSETVYVNKRNIILTGNKAAVVCPNQQMYKDWNKTV